MLKTEFKAIYNPYTRELAVRYGQAIIYHQFEDQEEWVAMSYDDDHTQPYFLHIQLDYDETLQLLFYPRKDGDDSLNEPEGTYYNSGLPSYDLPENIVFVHNDKEWDHKLLTFLKPTETQFGIHKKLNFTKWQEVK